MAVQTKGSITYPEQPASIAPSTTRTLSGWGANLRRDCSVAEPQSLESLAATVDHSGTSIARGLGRSYGDCAINSGRQVLSTLAVNRVLSFDDQTGILLCEAGLSLEQLIQHCTPRGWFPMITPGTKYVTIGGCIANDIHGKAHHVDGCFSNCVHSMTVLLASGEIVTASRTENEDLFWATFGGMGLLGIILTAAIQLRQVETTYFHQKSISAPNLESMLEALDENDHTYPYSVATLDVLATGKDLGRGVLTVGDHARRVDLPSKLAANPLRISGRPKLIVPFDLPEFTLNPLSIRIVNAVIQRIQASATPIGHYEKFFYPLDMIANWNRGYGRRGFTQYQFVIPFENGLVRMRDILTAILSSGQLPFLNVLKRLGRESGGTLSFPQGGYTFAIDFPIRRGTAELLRRLDAMVLSAGGRIYLGKDSFCSPETFRTMYPQLDRWLAIKRRYDPDNVFTSDLGRRLHLAA